MWDWTAKFLLLVMFVPILGPLALAGAAPAEGMHCVRRPMQATPAAQPAMHCHHAAAAQRPQPAASETSFRSLDCCCPNHECCRSLKTSEWVRPASNLLSAVSFMLEPALPVQMARRASATLAGPDSARAPPRC